MLLFRFACCLELVLGQCLVFSAPAAGQEGAFVAVQTNAPGAHTYVRRTEIEALSDVSPAHCVIILAPGGFYLQRKDDVRAFEGCASILGKLHGNNFISFPADFGSVYVSPEEINALVWTSNSRCRIAFKSGKFVYAKHSCDEVHKALLGK